MKSLANGVGVRCLLGLVVGMWACDTADEPLEPAEQQSRLVLSQPLREKMVSFSFAGRMTVLPDQVFFLHYSHPRYQKYFDGEGNGKISSVQGAEPETRYTIHWSVTARGGAVNLLSVTNVPKMFSPSEPLGGIQPGRVYQGARAFFYANVQMASGDYTVHARLSDGSLPIPKIIDTASLDFFLAPMFKFKEDLFLLAKGMSYQTFSAATTMKPLTAAPLRLDPYNVRRASVRLYLEPSSFSFARDFAAFAHFALSDAAYTVTSIRGVIDNFPANVPPLRKPLLYRLDHGTAVDPPQTSADHMVEYQPASAGELTRVVLDVVNAYGQKGELFVLLGV